MTRAAVLVVLGLLLSSPARAQCPEAAAGRIPAPTFAQVSIVDTTLIVKLGCDTVGFNRDWTFTLAIDDGTPGGYKPAPTACALTPIYDWYVAMTTFAGYAGCPCPSWFWVHSRPDDASPLGPMVYAVAPATGQMTVAISCHGVPIAVGAPWLVTITVIDDGGTGRPPAWEFDGVVQPPAVASVELEHPVEVKTGWFARLLRSITGWITRLIAGVLRWITRRA